jgi:hypothetical protein
MVNVIDYQISMANLTKHLQSWLFNFIFLTRCLDLHLVKNIILVKITNKKTCVFHAPYL